MRQRVSVFVGEALAANRDCAGTGRIVEANNGSVYAVYIDGNTDVVFRKSNNGGVTWSSATVVFVGTATHLSIWYDRWSGLSTDLIHMAYTESANDDTLYRTIDTGSADALSTQTVIFAGTSTAAGGHISITRARGGNVYCKTVIDAGAEGGFFRLPNANVPNGAWDAARTVDETIATLDQMILVPGFAADNQDIMAVFWDASANEVSRKIYDDSANSWAETSIAGSMVELATTTAFPNFDAVVDLTNSRIYLIAWSNTDTASARLRAWHFTESAITALTDVVSSSTDDQGLCTLSLNTVNGYLTAFYGGATAGGDTWNTSMNVYEKTSQDAGSTWSAERQIPSHAAGILQGLWSIPRFTKDSCPLIHNNETNIPMLRCVPMFYQPQVGGFMGA